MRLALRKKLILSSKPGRSSLLDGLLYYWPFNEETGVRADIADGADLSDVGGVGFDVGKNGNAASFSGANTLRRTNVVLDPSAGLSVVFWMKQTVAPDGAYRQLFKKGEFTPEFQFYTVTTTLHVDIWDTLGNAVSADSGPGVLVQNDWYLIIWWYDPADKKVRLSINNGAPIVSAALPANMLGGTTTIEFGAASGGQFFTGLIDAPGVWPRLFTLDERTELWNGGAGKFHPF